MVMAGPSDRSDVVGTLPQTERRDFSAVGYAEAMRRAREIVPILRERAQRGRGRADAACARTSSSCTRAGCSVFTSPKPSAGWSSTSWPSWTSRRSSRAAARPPPGTWATSPAITGSSATTIPTTQREVWDANPDALIASSIALAAGRGRKADGGFIVNGPLAVLLGGGQFGLEHAGRHRLRRRRQDAGRLAAVPGAQVRLRDHRHLVRHGHGGDRQQGRRGRRSCSCRSAGRCRSCAAAAGSSIRARRSTPARSTASRSWRRPAIRWLRRRSARPRAPTSCSSRRWRSARAPIPARGSRTSRPCRSRWRARAA